MDTCKHLPDKVCVKLLKGAKSYGPKPKINMFEQYNRLTECFVPDKFEITNRNTSLKLWSNMFFAQILFFK